MTRNLFTSAEPLKHGRRHVLDEGSCRLSPVPAREPPGGLRHLLGQVGIARFIGGSRQRDLPQPRSDVLEQADGRQFLCEIPQKIVRVSCMVDNRLTESDPVAKVLRGKPGRTVR